MEITHQICHKLTFQFWFSKVNWNWLKVKCSIILEDEVSNNKTNIYYIKYYQCISENT